MIVRLVIERGDSAKKEYFFKDTFRVGRDNSCSVKINDGLVSRDHLEISLKKGEWWIADLFSSNGTFLNGNKIDHLILSKPIKLELGKNGPIIKLELVSEVGSPNYTDTGVDQSVTSYVQRYFKIGSNDRSVGDHTRMIQQAFERVKKKQSKKYLLIIAIFAILCIFAFSYTIYVHNKILKQKELAESIFYQMKEIELALAKSSNNVELEKKFEEIRATYKRMINELDIYDLNESDKLIVKMASVFGECEINMPENFINEVNKYIKFWQSTNLFKDAINREKEYGYERIIVNEFQKQYLPPQFFYLALQESRGFLYDAVGPRTRYGYAKGIWQFIPPTARRYGLKTGPMVEENTYDPLDERFNFIKATRAAAHYIRDIYDTRAKASGLLVIASYNWGEHNIIPLIESLPEDPRKRNFWNLLVKYRDRIPDETYNYVFYIFSAAVIGENPRLFGFGFDNPLRD